MSDLQEELKALRDGLETAKKERADANSIVKELAAERRKLMAKKISLMDEAKQAREARDEQNKLAKEQKEKRDSLKGALSDVRAELSDLRSAQKELKENVSESRRDIERRIKELRDMLQRGRTKQSQEDKIINEIEDLEAKLGLFSRVKNAHEKLNKVNFNFGELQAESHAHHKMVVQYAEEGGQHHKNMQKLYDEANKIQKEIDEIVTKINEKQKIADEKHETVLSIAKKLNEINEKLGIEKKVEVESKSKEAEAQVAEYTDSLLQKLKSGEKVSV
ncbi:MAG: hypothetical protein JXA43_00240 [Candidatus Diapherotrites archaeon]|nr:hypothetical protein [Candidatus Diapherotrites archaeon]